MFPFTRAARHRRLFAVVLLLPGCGRACSSGDKKPEDKAPAVVETPGGVKLTARGREPRGKLEVGRWTGLEYEQTVEASGSIGLAGAPPARGPALVSTTRFSVLRGTADPIAKTIDGRKLSLVEERGEIVDVHAAGKDVPPAAIAQLDQALGLLKGIVTRQLVAEDGEIAEVTTQLVGGQKPSKEIKTLLDKLFDAQRRFPFRLPPAAVGVGAKWTFSEPIVIQGIHATQASEMTLTALDDKTAKIAIVVRQQGARQELQHPLDPSAWATVEQYRGDGNGEFRVDRLTSVVLDAHLATTGSLRLSWQEGDQPKNATFIAASVTDIRGHIGPPSGADGGVDAGDAALE